MIWTQDKIDLFTALYLAERPASDIADEFSISKRTVYSRASELGLSRKWKPVIKAKPLKQAYKPKVNVKSLVELTDKQCHFIPGEPTDGYCGLPVYKGCYCKDCYSVMYQVA